MDYFKLKEEMQKEFLENPRESINRMIKTHDNLAKELVNTDVFLKKPERILLLGKFHEEYSSLVGKMIKTKEVNGATFKDDIESIIVMQRIQKWKSAIAEHDKEINETTALNLAEAYASALEIFWKKLKKVIFLAGLNPKGEHLNVGKLLDKTIKLEKKYNVDLSQIKKVLYSGLRNPVNHEDTYFKAPNTVVFLNTKGETRKEVASLTTEVIYNLVFNLSIITMAFVDVENSLLISSIERLLKLNDEELNLFAKTGELTLEMQKKIYS